MHKEDTHQIGLRIETRLMNDEVIPNLPEICKQIHLDGRYHLLLQALENQYPPDSLVLPGQR